MYDYAAVWSGPSYLEEAGLTGLAAALNCSQGGSGPDCGPQDNDTWLATLANGTVLFNETLGNFTRDENLSEVIVMAVTSVILALIILITIIGKWIKTFFTNNSYRFI